MTDGDSFVVKWPEGTYILISVAIFTFASVEISVGSSITYCVEPPERSSCVCGRHVLNTVVLWRAVLYNAGSVQILPVNVIVREGNCHIFSLNFNKLLD